ncbi:hypothetical protein EJB05_06621, partial [Eragrostis curvula]
MALKTPCPEARKKVQYCCSLSVAEEAFLLRLQNHRLLTAATQSPVPVSWLFQAPAHARITSPQRCYSIKYCAPYLSAQVARQRKPPACSSPDLNATPHHLRKGTGRPRVYCAFVDGARRRGSPRVRQDGLRVQALPEEVPDPRALLQRRLPLPPLPQRVHGSSTAPQPLRLSLRHGRLTADFLLALFFLLFLFSCASSFLAPVVGLDWAQKDGHELDRNAVISVICLVCDTEQPYVTLAVHVSPFLVSRLRRSAATAEFVWASTSAGTANSLTMILTRSTTIAKIAASAVALFKEALKQSFPFEKLLTEIMMLFNRVGGKDNFFHCNKCGSCYSTTLREKHCCIENSMKNNCPICYEYMFDSLKETSVLRCGHTMHLQCFHEMLKHDKFSCPICSTSIFDMDKFLRALDAEMEESYYYMGKVSAQLPSRVDGSCATTVETRRRSTLASRGTSAVIASPTTPAGSAPLSSRSWRQNYIDSSKHISIN